MVIKCKLSTLSVHKKHLESLFKMQMPKHLCPKCHPLSLGQSPRTHIRMYLMKFICKPKLRHSNAKKGQWLWNSKNLKLVPGSLSCQLYVSGQITFSPWSQFSFFLFLKKYFVYLFLERGKGGRKRGRETSMCGCLSLAPCWGSGLQPRNVP